MLSFKIKTIKVATYLALSLWVSACGYIRTVDPESASTEAESSYKLIPLNDDYLIRNATYASVETYLKFSEAIGSESFDSVNYFDAFTEQLAGEVKSKFLGFSSAIGIQASVNAASENGRVIIDFDDPQTATIPGMVIDVNGRSLNCNAEQSAQLLDSTSAYLSSYVSNTYADDLSALTIEQFRYNLDKGNVLSFDVFGPENCLLRYTIVVGSIESYLKYAEAVGL